MIKPTEILMIISATLLFACHENPEEQITTSAGENPTGFDDCKCDIDPAPQKGCFTDEELDMMGLQAPGDVATFFSDALNEEQKQEVWLKNEGCPFLFASISLRDSVLTEVSMRTYRTNHQGEKFDLTERYKGIPVAFSFLEPGGNGHYSFRLSLK